ncbi:MAG TPA: acyl-CoA dehydrogenase family protein [Thermoanaerobaculia bacterium]|nr:acyl-CoA dehydrogenase family protein [Thermoanaerobaculia bacterium]
MRFGLDGAQSLLRDTVAQLARQDAPLERVRRIAEAEGVAEHRSVYAELGEAGVTGLLVPEEHGGAGLGLLEAAIAAQELGAAATPASVHASCVLAPLLLHACGSQAQRAEWLGGIASGDALVAVATRGIDERGGRLVGVAPEVADADLADVFLVVAGEKLYLAPAKAGGIDVAPLLLVDRTRRLGAVRFDLAVAGLERLPGPIAPELLERVVAASRVALAADALGACYRAIQLAVDYAKQREQFGRVIGSFQAVKHLCAEMIADTDPIQSFLWHAAHAWDREEADAPRLAALLKAHVAEVGAEVASKATQVFGGMGFTWECEVHWCYQRIGYARQVLGVPEELRDEAVPALVS